MAVTHGSVGAIDPSEEDWDMYVRREGGDTCIPCGEQDPRRDREAEHPPNCLWGKNYHIIHDLVALQKPTNKSYVKIVKCLKSTST